MKKIIYTFVVCFIFINILIAQDKYGNVWLIGQGVKSYNKLTWGQDSLNIIQPTTQSEAYISDPNACISDKKGNLLFYTSGCCVSSAKNYKVLPNGKKINPNEVYDSYCGVKGTSIYPSNNNVMFLPHPTDTSLYYLFHMARKAVNDTADQYPFTYFYYSVLDTKMGINGDIAKKNVLITEGRLSEVGPAGCKHGNGRDYWVIIPNTITHSFFRALLTKDTVLYMGDKR